MYRFWINSAIPRRAFELKMSAVRADCNEHVRIGNRIAEYLGAPTENDPQ
jgi:hypothetical protein